MNRVTLSWNLPEEKEEFLQSFNGAYWEAALWDLDQFLRGEIKYKDKPWQSVRDKLYDIIDNDYRLEWSE